MKIKTIFWKTVSLERKLQVKKPDEPCLFGITFLDTNVAFIFIDNIWSIYKEKQDVITRISHTIVHELIHLSEHHYEEDMVKRMAHKVVPILER